MRCLTFSKLLLFRKALLQCETHIRAKFNNPQQERFVTIALLKFILSLINSVWTVSFLFILFVCCCCLFFNPLPIFVPRGRGIWFQDYPQGLGVLVWFDQGLCQIPLSVPGLGRWGFQLTSALASHWIGIATIYCYIPRSSKYTDKCKLSGQVFWSWSQRTINISRL